MADFADCFSALDFSHHARVIVAISGGSDSTGLLVFLREYLKFKKPAPELVAVTIDHGLRAESANEAVRVWSLCEKLGVVHLTTPWEGEKPKTGIQAAAREARYRLLMQAAHENDATLILTGHTEDDQFETVFMRGERGEGPGLAGIAPATLAFGEHAPVWFARPFLTVTRAAIRGQLNRRGMEWIDDPSNDNSDYERVRVRQSLTSSLESDLAQLRQTQLEWAKKRADLSQRAARLMNRHVSEVSRGLFLISPALKDEVDAEAAAETLRICLAFAGGSEKMIETQSAADIVTLLESGEFFRKTGTGALMDRRRQGLFVLRENRNPGKMSEIAPAQAKFPKDVPASLARRALATVPSDRRRLYPWPVRVPLFNRAAASALAQLVGFEAFPPPPCSL